jgi:acetyl-CoA C-acetyltransferase
MSIRDKVAVIGMGCSRFGERWDAGADDLVAEAFTEALKDAGIDRERIKAAWLGMTMPDLGLGGSALGLASALDLGGIPVTRVENFCATGTDAFRGAVYAVASGAVDIALAVGVEKLKDVGTGGLPLSGLSPRDRHSASNTSGPGTFAQLASGYMAHHNISRTDLKKAMAHVSVKSHANGARNPKAHLRKIITEAQVLNAPIIAEPLGLFDCCGVSDGAAAAIVTTPQIARALGRHEPVLVKAIALGASSGAEMDGREWIGASMPNVRSTAQAAYAEAGITDPAKQLSMTEVHDCFSITELVLMEDLGLSAVGRASADILDGRYDIDGAIPCQVDGGLKCFGHPTGASGIRMLYEVYNQLQGRAGDRQLANVSLGLTQNLGGDPARNVCSVAILGLPGA